MGRYEVIQDALQARLNDVFVLQSQLVNSMLNDMDLENLGTVKGANGTYEVESVIFWSDGRTKTVKCRLKYEAFSTGTDFDDLTVSERQQIVDLALKRYSETDHI